MSGIRVAVALVTLAFVACAAPQIAEDSAAACSNGIDDDGDGLVDCADSACASTEACELDPVTCSNGVDDDRDGLVDCEQKSCVEAGFCEPKQADCDVVRQTGCLRGMSCQSRDQAPGAERVCARPGQIEENQRCSTSATDPSGGCRRGRVCYGLGLCVRPCETGLDCPRSSTCLRAANQEYGVCTLTCFPLAGCVEGYACVALQRLGDSYAAQGWMHSCVGNAAANGLAAKGVAKTGAPCVDGAFASTPPDTVCEAGLVCVPGPSGGACREICVASERGNDVKTCATGRCVAIDPFDARPPRPTEPYRFGVCLP